MRRSDKIECFLRIAVFGWALVVGVVGFGSIVYLVKRKRLRMLQT